MGRGNYPKENKRKRESSSEGEDALEAAAEHAEHHYMLRVGDEFEKGRCRVVGQLGKGTFGRVVEMFDSADQRSIAVKVVRAVEKYAREAQIEADILLGLQRTLVAGDERFPVCRLLRTFDSRGHFCLAFEKMGPSLYSLLKSARPDKQGGNGGGRGGPGSYFSLSQIGCVARYCFKALAHMHSIKLTHTDLKPENILLVEHGEKARWPLSEHIEVALIDFGGATWEADHHSSVVCTRQYRPPEVSAEREGRERRAALPTPPPPPPLPARVVRRQLSRPPPPPASAASPTPASLDRRSARRPLPRR